MIPATANYLVKLGKGLELDDLRMITDGRKCTLHVRTIAPLEPEDFDALLPYFPKKRSARGHKQVPRRTQIRYKTVHCGGGVDE